MCFHVIEDYISRMAVVIVVLHVPNAGSQS